MCLYPVRCWAFILVAAVALAFTLDKAFFNNTFPQSSTVSIYKMDVLTGRNTPSGTKYEVRWV